MNLLTHAVASSGHDEILKQCAIEDHEQKGWKQEEDTRTVSVSAVSNKKPKGTEINY